MTSWEDVELLDAESGRKATVGDTLLELRATAIDAPSETFDRWLELIAMLQDAHIYDGATAAIAAAHEVFSANEVDVARWPWLLNLEGVAHSRAGRFAEARAAFDEMRRLGEQIPDVGERLAVTSTAQQNLGNALLEEDPVAAVDLLRVALRRKRELDDVDSALEISNSLGLGLARLGLFDEAETTWRDLVDAARRADARNLESSAWGNLGTLRVERRDLGGAAEAFKHALEIARADGDVPHQVHWLQNLGLLHSEIGQVAEATRFHELALELATVTASKTLELQLRRSLAVLLVEDQQWDRAETELTRSISLAEALGDRGAQADVLADLGALRVEQGQVAAGEDLLGRAVEMLADDGDDRRLVDILRNQGELAALRDDYQRAAELFGRAERLQEQTNAGALDAELVQRHAELLLENGQGGSAAESFQRAIDLHASTDEQAAHWLSATAGTLLLNRGFPELAHPFLRGALAHYELNDDVRLASRVRNDLALALAALGKLDDGRALIHQSLEAAAALGDRALRLQSALNLAELHDRVADRDLAARWLGEALDLATALDDHDAIAYAVGHLAYVQLEADQREAARATLALIDSISGPAAGDLPILLTVRAALALLDGDADGAAQGYADAAELHHGTYPRGEVESVGGLLESLIAQPARDEQRIQDSGQRLVTLAQQTGNEDIAWAALTRSGVRAWRVHEQELAISLWEIALRVMVVAATEKRNLFDETLIATARPAVADSVQSGPALNESETDFLARASVAMMTGVWRLDAEMRELPNLDLDVTWSQIADALTHSFGESRVIRDLIDTARKTQRDGRGRFRRDDA